VSGDARSFHEARSFHQHEEYVEDGLDDGALGPDPIAALEAWLRDAEEAGIQDPNAMVVGTVDADGQPSSRTVLWKGIVDGALAFYTNRESHKGEAIAHESRVSLLFPWYALHRQVRVEGIATIAPDAVSDEYFASRPRGSQVAAWASAQSQPIGSREELDARQDEAEARFDGVDVVLRPPHWGGYLVTPSSIEFWQGRVSRMHDRQLYVRVGEAWTLTRLQP
jgi:pyridoxamine 5'-phosphate oxidase